MKNILFILFIGFYYSGYTQPSLLDVDCDKISKARLLNVYSKYKNLGFTYHTKSGVNVMEYMIDESSFEMLRQLCIDSWFDVNQYGSTYTHGRFTRRNFTIQYNQYLDDIYYLEILSAINQIILKNK